MRNQHEHIMDKMFNEAFSEFEAELPANGLERFQEYSSKTTSGGTWSFIKSKWISIAAAVIVPAAIGGLLYMNSSSDSASEVEVGEIINNEINEINTDNRADVNAGADDVNVNSEFGNIEDYNLGAVNNDSEELLAAEPKDKKLDEVELDSEYEVFSLKVNFEIESTVCGDGNGGIKAIINSNNRDFDFEWKDNKSIKSLQRKHLDAGTYSLIIKDESGKERIFSADVKEKEYVESGFYHTEPVNGLPLPIQFTNTTKINGKSYKDHKDIKFRWSFGDESFSSEANPSHFYKNPGKYDVALYVTGPNGCTSTMIVANVRVNNGSEEMKVVTPNGDGKDDVFKAESYNLKNFKCVITDMDGTIIKSWTDPSFEWNCNEAKESGVYFFTVSGKSKKKNQEIRNTFKISR